jgi:hypothetical protein
MNQQALAGLPLQARTAATIEPGTHIVMRMYIARPVEDADGHAQLKQVLCVAAQVTRHGGLITDLTLPDGETPTVFVNALLTIRQAVEVLLEDAHTQIDAITPPQSLFCSATMRSEDGAEAGDPITTWLSAKDEEAREIGVRRLELLLTDAGYDGDLGRVADELWTRCGL